MGAIAGIFSQNKDAIVREILEKMKHRGTRKPKVISCLNATLGAIGLARVKEKPGPLCTPSGERTIVIDGRIMNKKLLEGSLEAHSLSKRTSAEAVLHFYEEQSSEVFEKLEGEFALVIVDGEQMFLGRDRLGIRPLYYGFHDGCLCFASEIKALVDLVDEVHEFPPGHFMSSDLGMFSYPPYFPEEVELNGAHESAEQVADYLSDAIQRAIPDCNEVGVWLSGGVDSSVVAALARPFVNKLHTFSAGTEQAPDLKYARQVAGHIDSEHHEVIYSLDDMQGVLDKVIYQLESFDAPLVRSSIPNYMVAGLAAEYVPFVLSGEGGDELFAGYSYQKNCESGVELMLSVQEAIAALHNTALQRVDRSAAAHSLGVAVPFLDPDVVRYALAIPSRWKIRGTQSIEKWPLRQGLADELPDRVIWRKKVKFWKGAGVSREMQDCAQQKISDQDFEAERYLAKDFVIRSKEELLYYRIFKQFFGEKVLLSEVGRTRHV